MNSDSSDQGGQGSTEPPPPERSRRIKIGSQREGESTIITPTPATAETARAEPATEISETTSPSQAGPAADSTDAQVESNREADTAPTEKPSFPPPRIQRSTPELEAEIEAALGDFSIEELVGDPGQGTTSIEVDSRVQATVVKVHRDDIFFSLPGHQQGVASSRQMAEPPTTGQMMEVVVSDFNAEEGLYEVRVPGTSVDVDDWSDLSEGVVVDARITGHNAGGLECEVGRLRGFIPASQISVYRVEDFSQFVDEKLQCVVTEANPSRRNLVLSHRAVMEREKEEARQKLLATLEVGQTHEGVVRSIREFGAFVDIGGADGLIHVSQLSWDRVSDPHDVVEVGQRVKVKIEKFDPETGKIGLSYRDLLEHPWEDIENKFPVHSIVKGTVSKIMDFGAFVRLGPGVEGLVHISELAHHRVHRVSNVVNEGESVEVKVLSIDRDSQKMSLSIKAALAAPPTEGGDVTEKATDDDTPAPEPYKSKRTSPLKGGTNKSTGGENFGLNW